MVFLNLQLCYQAVDSIFLPLESGACNSSNQLCTAEIVLLCDCQS